MQQAQLSFDLEPPPAPAAAPIRSRIILPAPALIIHWTPFWADFLQNVVDLITQRETAFVPTSVRPGQFWTDVFVQRPLPWKELAQSGVLHVLVAAFVAL